MNNETWLPVAGYEGLYEVSNLGRVRSLVSGRVRRPAKDHGGYLIVTLCKNGEQKTYRAHRLVATAFHENPLNLPEVNHRNEVKTDNRAMNLEWCDATYNNAYGTRIERISTPVYQYDLDGAFVAWYPSTAEAARRTGVNHGAISSCASGKRKTQGGFQWRYTPALFLDATDGKKNNAQSKHVYQYTLDGRFVKEWMSVKEIQRQTGWSQGNISNCARSERNSAYGFRWFYEYKGLRINVSPNPQD